MGRRLGEARVLLKTWLHEEMRRNYCACVCRLESVGLGLVGWVGYGNGITRDMGLIVILFFPLSVLAYFLMSLLGLLGVRECDYLHWMG